MFKKLDGRLVIYLSLLSLVLFAYGLLGLLRASESIETTKRIEQWTQVEQTVIPIGQLNAFELEIVVSEAMDSGNDSNGFLLYQTSNLNEIENQPVRSKRLVILISPHESLGGTLIRDMLADLEKSSTKSIAPGKFPLMTHTKVISVHQSHIGLVADNWLPKNLKIHKKRIV